MIIPISNNTITHFLKFLQIIYNFASQEGISIMEQWLVNDNCSASGFDSPYNTGNRGLAEVIGIGFHGKAVYADGTGFLTGRIVAILIGIAIISGLF